MDIKNAMGVANVMAIFSDLSKEAKQIVIQDLVNSGDIPTMQWQCAVKNKPHRDVPVFARGGIYKEPLSSMVVWTGENWCYYSNYVEVESVSDFCVPY